MNAPPRRSDGTIQHTRLKQPWPAGRPFRILTIDGGGIRGVFPAAYLAVDRGERIFPTDKGWRKRPRLIRWLSKPKHDGAVLRRELTAVFGAKTLDEACKRVVIPSFEGRHGEPFIYKTPHHSDYQLDRVKPLVDVALHTQPPPPIFRRSTTAAM